MMNRLSLLAAATVLVAGLAPGLAWAHCDTLDGPVVQAARTALAKGEVTPVLRWVRATDEAEIKAAFRHTLAVRGLGPEARELADRYFFETLVRIHRAGEGMPYTGLKAEAVEPIIALADAALDSGSVDSLVAKLTAHISEGIRERFEAARHKQRQAETSVAAGRKYVAAYVEFVHYVEGLHTAAEGVAVHHTAEPAAPAAETPHQHPH